MKKIILSLTLISLIYTACVPLRAVKYLVPDAGDSARFNNLNIQKSTAPFYFKPYQSHPAYTALHQKLDSALVGTKTNAFIVIKNDSTMLQIVSKFGN